MLKVTNDRVVRLAPPHSAPARLAPSGQLAVGPGVPVSRCRLARPVPARAQCLKFETDQQQDLKRIDKLNALFLSYMCGKDPYADPGEDVVMGGAPRPASAGDDAPTSSERPASGGGTPGRNKKKAKK